MAKRTILITGATDGIGKQTALDLGKNPENFLIIHGRNESRCKAVVEQLKKLGCAKCDWIVADFGKMQQVKSLGDELKGRFPKLNVVIANAGVLLPKREVSSDGIEMTFQITDLLKANAPARIAIVSSICHDWYPMDWADLEAENSYEKYTQYSRTKLANHLFGFALAKRLSPKEVTCNVLEPGVIQTKLLAAGGFSGAPVESSSRASVHLAQSGEVEGVTGKYFSNSAKVIKPCAESCDGESQEKLWKISVEMCKKLGVWMDLSGSQM